MRYSRILAVLIMLCFTFAGTTMLFAGEKKDVVIDGKKLSISFDAKSNAVEVKDAADNPVNVVGPPTKGTVGQLRLHEVGATPEKILSVNVVNVDGNQYCEIHTTYNPTCTWRFIGGDYVKVCVYP